MTAIFLLFAALVVLAAGELNLTITFTPPTKNDGPCSLEGSLSFVGEPRPLLSDWLFYFDGSQFPSQERPAKECLDYPCTVKITDLFTVGFHEILLRLHKGGEELIKTNTTILVPEPLDNCSIGTANFLATNAEGNFTIDVTNVSLAGALTAVWDFGDEGTDTPGAATHHSFATAGFYTVTANVHNSLSSCQPTASLMVLDEIAKLVLAGPTIASPEALLQFNSSIVRGTRVRYSWTFGDGEVRYDGGTAPTHTYHTAGQYTVVLVAYNAISFINASMIVTVAPASSPSSDPPTQVVIPVVVSIFSVLLLALLVAYHRWYYRTRKAEHADFLFARPPQRPQSLKMRFAALLGGARTPRKYDTFDDDDDDNPLK